MALVDSYDDETKARVARIMCQGRAPLPEHYEPILRSFSDEEILFVLRRWEEPRHNYSNNAPLRGPQHYAATYPGVRPTTPDSDKEFVLLPSYIDGATVIFCRDKAGAVSFVLGGGSPDNEGKDQETHFIPPVVAREFVRYLKGELAVQTAYRGVKGQIKNTKAQTIVDKADASSRQLIARRICGDLPPLISDYKRILQSFSESELKELFVPRGFLEAADGTLKYDDGPFAPIWIYKPAVKKNEVPKCREFVVLSKRLEGGAVFIGKTPKGKLYFTRAGYCSGLNMEKHAIGAPIVKELVEFLEGKIDRQSVYRV